MGLSRGEARIIHPIYGSFGTLKKRDEAPDARSMVAWTYERGVQLHLIQPVRPNQNAYVESSRGRVRDECLNKHWVPTPLHARTEIVTWQREYNSECPKRILGGLTPAAYA